MQELRYIFRPHIAKSHPLSVYSDGNIPLISNGLESNGFVKYVTPLPRDKVFQFKGLCISAFCEATVQRPPFIVRGNAGSGLTVLEPLVEMNDNALLWYAAYFNRAVRWRFSYGRMASIGRLSRIKLPLPSQVEDLAITPLIPKSKEALTPVLNLKLTPYPLVKLFTLKSGDYHKAEDLLEGAIPLVSCGTGENGILRYCDVPKNRIYRNALTVAYNGQPLTTKYHPYQFAAKDDVAVLLPIKPLKGTTLLFIQMMLNSEQWRYSYGRKCYKAKLSRMQLLLPIKNSEIDEQGIAGLIGSTSYWDFLSPMIYDSNT